MLMTHVLYILYIKVNRLQNVKKKKKLIKILEISVTADLLISHRLLGLVLLKLNQFLLEVNKELKIFEN